MQFKVFTLYAAVLLSSLVMHSVQAGPVGLVRREDEETGASTNNGWSKRNVGLVAREDEETGASTNNGWSKRNVGLVRREDEETGASTNNGWTRTGRKQAKLPTLYTDSDPEEREDKETGALRTPTIAND
ncbi:hypothetical protein HYDPIDRAFT_34932 [Hydnomerulius pinastri MD-312]|uniref:Uncharacterized protein n=1 Tax=Hydnomerulius pinastri MD-312 TaxID=994086 RepID=A0A0C9VJM1_9AGAM|nr:hypothetical protein HYDPIDRAFT_34932 [Hydnomerulius pinastri MD-312]